MLLTMEEMEESCTIIPAYYKSNRANVRVHYSSADTCESLRLVKVF